MSSTLKWKIGSIKPKSLYTPPKRAVRVLSKRVNSNRVVNTSIGINTYNYPLKVFECSSVSHRDNYRFQYYYFYVLRSNTQIDLIYDDDYRIDSYFMYNGGQVNVYTKGSLYQWISFSSSAN